MSDPLRQAACIGRSDIMEGRTMDARATAVSICASCPMGAFVACDELARTLYAQNGEPVGVWASTFYEPAGNGPRHRPRRLEEPTAGLKHGTGSGRRRGCRCEPCLDWERAKSSERAKVRAA